MSEDTGNPSTSMAEGLSAEDSPGQLLFQVRTAQKLDIDGVAAELRLTKKYVVALEEDNFERLPAEPFVVGYYKAYSRLLGIDAGPIIAAYRSISSSDSNIDTADNSSLAENASAGLVQGKQWLSQLNSQLLEHRRVITIGAVLFLVLIAGLFILAEDDAAAPQSINPKNSSATLEQSTETALDSGSDEISALIQQPIEAHSPSTDLAPSTELDGGLQEASPVDSERQTIELSATSNTALKPEEDTSVVAVAVSAIETLDIQFSDECWLEVVDGEGKNIANDLYRRGDRISLKGLAPFNVLFGDARVVRVQLNGEEVAVEPKGDRHSLRLTIDKPQP